MTGLPRLNVNDEIATLFAADHPIAKKAHYLTVLDGGTMNLTLEIQREERDGDRFGRLMVSGRDGEFALTLRIERHHDEYTCDWGAIYRNSASGDSVTIEQYRRSIMSTHRFRLAKDKTEPAMISQIALMGVRMIVKARELQAFFDGRLATRAQYDLLAEILATGHTKAKGPRIAAFKTMILQGWVDEEASSHRGFGEPRKQTVTARGMAAFQRAATKYGGRSLDELAGDRAEHDEVQRIQTAIDKDRLVRQYRENAQRAENALHEALYELRNLVAKPVEPVEKVRAIATRVGDLYEHLRESNEAVARAEVAARTIAERQRPSLTKAGA